MKNLLLILLMLTAFHSGAQVAEKPEDVCPLLVGEIIPDVKLKTAGGKEISTHQFLKKQKSIILVYRGGWCPYCNVHLNEISKIERELKNFGYLIVAIGTDSPEEMTRTMEKNKISYLLASDSDGAFSKACGIAFRAPVHYEKILTKNSEGVNKEYVLPVPAVFITDETGKILFEYLNPDYKTRIGAEVLLPVAKAFSEN
jgi:peroxiredoxin